MRHATWLRLEASPLWRVFYPLYHKLPSSIRGFMRVLATPRWHVAAWLVRHGASNRVVSGPFAGMPLVLSPLSQRHHLGYILGSQEMELHSVIEAIVERHYASIVNIGAADGYYAIGLAFRSPGTRVTAFEALPELHPVIERAARMNNVGDRVKVRGFCEPVELQRELRNTRDPVLVLTDIEGGEFDLLDPEAIKELRHVDILVETHDFARPGTTETLLSRFKGSHQIDSYVTLPRTLCDYPAHFLPWLKRLSPVLALELMNERRPTQQTWLFMAARERRRLGTS